MALYESSGAVGLERVIAHPVKTNRTASAKTMESRRQEAADRIQNKS
jgi:hypothetical protein